MLAPDSPLAPDPSSWVVRWAPEVAASGTVLDVACGRGRHSRYFVRRGHVVFAVDQAAEAIAALTDEPNIRATVADIEDGPWPYSGQQFSAVVVTNYLHRPIMPQIWAAVAPGGLLIYETFTEGNANYGRPARPEYLLRPGELLGVVNESRVLAYEDVLVSQPKLAMVQRICARKSVNLAMSGG